MFLTLRPVDYRYDLSVFYCCPESSTVPVIQVLRTMDMRRRDLHRSTTDDAEWALASSSILPVLRVTIGLVLIWVGVRCVTHVTNLPYSISIIESLSIIIRDRNVSLLWDCLPATYVYSICTRHSRFIHDCLQQLWNNMEAWKHVCM